MNSKVAFYTLGCKLNFSESSTIGKQFLTNGFDVVEFSDYADVYIINTCTVTDNADKECRQIIRRALRKNPKAFIAVTGCYAQLRPNEISSIEGVDAVFGSNEKFEILSLIESFEKKEISCVYISDQDDLNTFHSASSTEADSRTRAFLKIQDGCDYKCTFCTIPMARGKSRSSSVDNVIENFKDLVSNGYKEIILTGVNVGDYKNSETPNLYELLKKMLLVEGDFRLRISSIEPNLLTDEIIELTKKDKRMCDHFHIPLQSGSDDILKLMKRRYRTEDYKTVVEKLNKSITDVGIGIDVIVGFPGETKEHFMETYNFIKSLPVSYLHVFTYSERPNTPAISMDGNVENIERKERNKMLRILSEKKKAAFYNNMIGKDLKVLFEHTNHDGLMKGFASNYTRVAHPYNSDLVNNYKSVKIAETANGLCISSDKNSSSINLQAG